MTRDEAVAKGLAKYLTDAGWEYVTPPMLPCTYVAHLMASPAKPHPRTVVVRFFAAQHETIAAEFANPHPRNLLNPDSPEVISERYPTFAQAECWAYHEVSGRYGACIIRWEERQ